MRRRLVILVVGVGVVATVFGAATAATAAAVPTHPTATPAGPARGSAVPGAYLPVTPSRVLDTRIDHGGAAVAAHGTLNLRVTGVGGVPATGVSAVALHVTVLSPGAGGYLTVYPAGSTRPDTANINFAAGSAVGNQVLAEVGANGAVALYNSAATKLQLTADVSGYYTAGTPTDAGAFQPVTPTRVLDTRTKVGAAEPAGHGQVVLTVTGAGGVPATGVGAIALNLAATGATAGGWIAAYPDDGGARLSTSNITVVAGTAVADLVVVSVPADGKIVLYNGSTKPVQLIGDVAGYFRAGQPHLPGALNAVAPQRVLDTRPTGDGDYPEPAAKGVLAFKPGGQDSIPPTGATAVLLTVSVIAPKAGGYLTVYAGGTSRPNTSSLNFRAGQTVGNLVLAPISAGGVVDLYNGSAGKTEIVADVAGYYSSLPNPWTATSPELPSGQGSDGIAGVSCPTSSSCVAVGTWSTQTPYQVEPLIETLAGGTWTQLEQDAPGPNIERQLTAVSCVSATSCTAVGYDHSDDATGPEPLELPVAETLENGVWTATELPAPPTDPDDDLQTAQLTGISCTSATACVAVGTYFTGEKAEQMLVETLSGTTWTATEPAVPAGDSGQLQAVSCTSDTACVAVGGITPGPSGSNSAAIETLSGGAWVRDTTLAASYVGKAGAWTGVSCPATGACTAVSDNGIAATLSGGSWTGATTPRGLNAVSCSAPTACTAVGSYDSDRAGDRQPLSAELQGATWTQFGLTRPSGSGQLYAVSCPGDRSCVAGGLAVTYPATGPAATPLLESDLAA